MQPDDTKLTQESQTHRQTRMNALLDRPALEECYVDDGAVVVDELKDDHFERVAVLVRRVNTMSLCTNCTQD